ncbi:hypothetical protein [Teredinibacter waterburyi]|uniref:hypothetical protein n=1 Tax=Teredinibacter waterburyi TaxID=1500538 RepID=UPI00165EC6AF|nr:hypothetical protein [Teredinibacter waterburyi]
MAHRIRKLSHAPIILALLSSYTSALEDVKLSGFARLVGGHLDTKAAEFKGYDDGWSIQPSSLIGLQVDADINPEISLTAQLIGHADDNKDSGIEWLYVTWRPLDQLTIKAGQLRTPFFTLSEVRDIGFAYPWVAPPQQVYNGYLFDTYDGINLTWGYAGKGFDASLELWGGRYDGAYDDGFGDIEYSVSQLAGAIGRINYRNFEFRASRYRGEVDLKIPSLDQFAGILSQYGFSESAASLNTEGAVDVNQLGIVYDNLSYFVRAEWVDITPEMTMIPGLESGYLSAGYNFTPATLHLTFANSRPKISSPEQEIPLGVAPALDALNQQYTGIFATMLRDDLQSITLGCRWDVSASLALKAEWSILKGKAGSNSFYTLPADDFDRKANLYLLGAEWNF